MRSKTFYLMLILIIFVMALVYVFLNEDNSIDNEVDNPNIEPGNEVKNQIIKPIVASEKDMNHYTLLEEYLVDFNNDSIEEKVELYAQVGVAEDGEYMWDDGQKWLLLVRSGENIYVLYDEYLQLGKLDVKLYKSFDENSIHLTTSLEAGAGYLIKDYTFNIEEDYFEEEFIFEETNISWIQKVY